MDIAEVLRPEFIPWALEKSQYGLIVRLTLARRPNTRPGDEQVFAALLARFADDDGPVAGVASYRSMLGAGTTYSAKASSIPDEWSQLMGEFTSSWTKHWLPKVEVVCLLSAENWSGGVADTHEIPVTSVLAIQHLARLEGALKGLYHASDSADERTIVHTMEHRLRTIIINANVERELKLSALT